MLRLASPAALWIGLAALPAVLLYFLRMRFRRKAIGTTFIWRALAAATSGGEALKRRSILLLLLQLAAIALAAFAAAGPYLASSRALLPGRIFLIDVSASMASRDGMPDGAGRASRAEAAVAAARAEIRALGEDVPIMAFACAASARPLLPEATFDKAAAAAALGAAAAGSEAFSEASCAEAISAWIARNGAGFGSWRGWLATDGGLDLGGRRIAAAFAGDLSVATMGRSGASLGVAGLRLEGGSSARASFALWNGWPAPKIARLKIARGSEELGSGSVTAAPGWSSHSLGIVGKAEEGAYSINLESDAEEAGALDSAPGGASYLSVKSGRALSILLVGRNDPFLKAALAFGGISYRQANIYPASLEGIDLVIADRPGAGAGSPPAGAPFQLLVFGDPPPGAPIASRGLASGAIVSTEPSHPISRFLAWEGTKAEGATAYALRGQASVLATAGGSPILVAWERGGFRSLACGIDLARSDLGLKGAFPVLLRNFLEWCVPSPDEQSAYTLTVGEGAKRALTEAFRARGIEVTRSGPAALLTARRPGFFDWEEGASRGLIAANVPAGELDATPRGLEVPSAPGSSAGAALASGETPRSYPLGAWVILLLAACLAAEWLAWRGGSSGAAARSRNAARRPGAAA